VWGGYWYSGPWVAPLYTSGRDVGGVHAEIALRLGTKWTGDLMISEIMTIVLVPHDFGQASSVRLLNATGLGVWAVWACDGERRLGGTT
jgi:hypothetical protein